MRLLIIRHGDPNYEKDCLTEKGKREATLLAEKLKKEKIDYFYTSPFGRAKETCMTVAKAMGRENEVVEKEFLKEFFENHGMIFIKRPESMKQSRSPRGVTGSAGYFCIQNRTVEAAQSTLTSSPATTFSASRIS